MPPAYRVDLIPATPLEEMHTAFLETYAPLLALATGGIYPYTGLGDMSISRDNTPLAFDADLELKPCIVVKARAPIPDNRIFDIDERLLAASQVIEYWVYQRVGYVTVSQIVDMLFNILHGYRFTGYWKTQWIYTTPYLKDDGALKGASCIRTDFISKKLRKAITV